MSLFHKNGVITGQVNCYCLPCEVPLGTESAVRAHIADSRHKQSLDSTSYVDIYKDDGIRKVPQGYYCEYCNKLFIASFKVKIHVSGGEHQRNKDTTWLKHQGDVVIVLNQLAIDTDSWHGLVDGSCALCNSEYLDKEAHKTIPTHLIKLIQSSVELHASGAIYRKGDNFFHCLVCNAVYSVNCFETHFQQKDHVKFYRQCCESFKNTAINGHMNDVVTFNDNIQSSYVNTTNFNENLDLKFADSKSAIPKIEKNMSVANQRLQRNTAELTLCEVKEKPPKKDCAYAKVLESKSDDVTENRFNIYNASEICQFLQTTENLEDVCQELLPSSKSKTNAVNEKYILKPSWLSNKEQVYDNKEQVYDSKEQDYDVKEQIYNEDQSEVIDPKDSQTQNTGSLQLESSQTNEIKIDTVNEEGISGLQFTNKAQVCKSEEKIYDRDHTEIIAPEDLQTQQTMGTVHSKLVRNNGDEIDSVNEKEISELQLTNKAQVVKSEENIYDSDHIEIIAPEDLQTQQTTRIHSESARNNGRVIDTVNENIISEWQLTNIAQVSERKMNKENEKGLDTINPDISETQLTEFIQVAPELLRNTDNEINMVNENQIEGQDFENNKPISIVPGVKQNKESKKEKALQIAKANKIRYKEGYTKAYCSVCSTEIPSSLKNIKLHVNNETHKHNAEKIYKYVSNVRPQSEFIEQIVFERLEPLGLDVIINNIYCIGLLSYSLLTKYQSHIRCHVCDVNFKIPMFSDHQQSETHKGALANTSVVCSLPSEFVREVQPGFYHCGFCHSFEGSWQRLTDHCKLPSHAQQKLRAAEKLLYYLSDTNQLSKD